MKRAGKATRAEARQEKVERMAAILRNACLGPGYGHFERYDDWMVVSINGGPQVRVGWIAAAEAAIRLGATPPRVGARKEK